MKVIRLSEEKPEFEPIELNLVIENKEELLELILRMVGGPRFSPMDIVKDGHYKIKTVPGIKFLCSK